MYIPIKNIVMIIIPEYLIALVLVFRNELYKEAIPSDSKIVKIGRRYEMYLALKYLLKKKL